MSPATKIVRVVVVDPESRDAVTYEFEDMAAMVEWAKEQMKETEDGGAKA